MNDQGRATVLAWQGTVDAAWQRQSDLLAGLAPAAGAGPGQEPPLPPYNVESPGPADHALWLALTAGANNYLGLKGWMNAQDMFFHYLHGNGEDYQVDPGKIMKDVPSFQRDVDAFVDSHRGTGSFDSGWLNTNTDITDSQGNVTGQQSLDWYYAMHDWRYRVTGKSIVEDGLTLTDYKVEVFKPYVFGSPRSDVNIPVFGGHLPQDDIQHLNATGLARNFYVTGSRSFH
jgi:hypothetical protein